MDNPARKVGRTITAGFFDPEMVIRLIIVVGKNCNPALAKIMVRIIGKVTTPLLSSIFSIALIPSGTEAPPIPRRLAEIERERYFFAGFERFLPQSFLIIGARQMLRYCESLVFSIIEIMPSHTAYTAKSSRDKFIALVDPESIAGKIDSGAIKSIIEMDRIKTTDQILFILNYI